MIYLAAIAVAIAMCSVWLAGFREDSYVVGTGRALAEYPAKHVVVLCVAILIEAVGVYVIIRPRTYLHSYGRAVCAFMFAIPFFYAGFFGLFHAPPYWYPFAVWTAVVLAGSGLLAAIAGFKY
jgi:hypothetical protein